MSRRAVAMLLAVILGAAALAVAFSNQRLARAQGAAAEAAEYDIVIRDGHIIDGTGSPWYSGDIGIRGGRIAAIGDLSHAHAAKEIDAAGRVVAPGFIDMLGQSEVTILVDPHVESKIFQGITTEITGEGDSVGPQTDATLPELNAGCQHYGITCDWRSFTQYFDRLQKQGMGINLGTYVGATQVRRAVIGEQDVQATAAQLDEMKSLVAEAMREGAMGLSSALEYPPAPYASTDELIALASVASQYGGIYATHMRNEGDGEMEALRETVRIAREAHIPVEIFHLKTAGKSNWGKMPEVVAFIDKERSEGVDIAADTYAYTAWANGMAAFIPPWAHDGGNEQMLARLRDPAQRQRIRKDMETPSKQWDNEWQEIAGPQGVLLCELHNPDLVHFEGKTLADVAKAWHEDGIDALFDLLIKDNGRVGVADFGMSEPDIEFALKQPWVSFDNDSSGEAPSGVFAKFHPHPRTYGTFPRIIRKYVRQNHVLTLPEAIRKFSALPAQREHMADRGVLKDGIWADIVVFNPAQVRDLATYANPQQLSVGMDYVLVNGVPVIVGGKMTNALPGKVIYGPGYVGEH